MNLTEIDAIVADYIDDTGQTLDQYIIDSVNYLSNFFHVNKIDTSQTTTDGDTTLTLPTLSKKIRRIRIADAFIPELLPEHQQSAEDNDVQRWYEDDGKIQFTKAFTATGTAVTIWYDKKFTEPTAGVDTDVPVQLLELVYAGAAYRFHRKTLSAVITNREDYPDVDPDEARRVRDDWRDEYNDLLDRTKKQNEYK